MKHSLSMLSAILESSADAILVTDENGRVITRNRKFMEMWEIPSEVIESRDRRLQEITGKQFANPEAVREQIAEIYLNAPRRNFRRARNDHGRKSERCSKIQSVEGRNMGRVWSFRDITGRKQAQEAKAHLAAIVENSDDAIISKDLNSTSLVGIVLPNGFLVIRLRKRLASLSPCSCSRNGSTKNQVFWSVYAAESPSNTTKPSAAARTARYCRFR